MAGSTGKRLTNKECKKCKSKLELWWAEDVGGYSCPGCGAHFNVEEYWDEKPNGYVSKKIKREQGEGSKCL